MSELLNWAVHSHNCISELLIWAVNCHTCISELSNPLDRPSIGWQISKVSGWKSLFSAARRSRDPDRMDELTFRNQVVSVSRVEFVAAPKNLMSIISQSPKIWNEERTKLFLQLRWPLCWGRVD